MGCRSRARGTPGAPDKRISPQEPPASGEQASAPPAVELRDISKDFGSNRALDSVDLRIGQGEVVGLVGQNGSGKSTLVKVLSGVYAPEPGGRMFVSGEEVPLPLPPGQASEIGLSFVYQNLALAAGLTVLENLTLGQRIGGGAQAWAPINWLGSAERRGSSRPLPGPAQPRPADGRTGAGRPGAAGDRPGRRRPAQVPHAKRPQALGARPRRADRVPSRGGRRAPLRSHPGGRGRGRGGAVHLARPGRGPLDHRPCGRAQRRQGRRRRARGRDPRARAGRSHRRGIGAVGRERPGGRSACRSRPCWRGKASADRPAGTARAGPGENVVVEHLTDGRLADVSFEIGAGEILGVAGLIGSGAEDLPYLLFGAHPATAARSRLGRRDTERRRAQPPALRARAHRPRPRGPPGCWA